VLPAILIRIEDDGGQHTLRLFESHDSVEWPTKGVSAALPQPAPPVPPTAEQDEIAAIRAFLLDPTSAKGLQRIGAYLHELLDSGDVGRRWRERSAGGGVRLMLDVRAPRLQRLPWELLFAAPDWLCADPSRPLMRVTSAFPGAAEIRPVRWPLRVLVIEGSKKKDAVVDAEKEIRRLEHAFRRLSGLVDVDFLHQPSREEIRSTYKELRPHVVHFIGHGDVVNDRAQLLLHDAARGQDEAWTADLIGLDLAGWQPRLAILNACRSNSVEDQDGAWGIAELFQRLGVPAVIAMQADIRGDAAAEFTGSLYTSLAADQPLDVAVSEGRNAITRVSGVTERDFALPTLTVSAPPENLLRMCFGVPDTHRPQVEYLRRRWAGFTDRTSERRRLLPSVDPEPEEHGAANGHPRAGGIAITGKGAVGKSELAQWCVAACVLHGGNAAYVNLDREGALTFRRTLEIIGEELGRTPVHGASNRDAIAEWHAQMERLHLGRDDAPPDALVSSFTYFSDALRAAACERLLLIVLDHVHKVQDEDWALISDQLLVPIARDQLAPVRMIVVVSDDKPVPISADLREAIDPIELSVFRLEQFKPVASEYFRHRFDVGIDLLSERVEKLQAAMQLAEFTWRDVTGLHDLLTRSPEWPVMP
jgi:hypothetical protein